MCNNNKKLNILIFGLGSLNYGIIRKFNESNSLGSIYLIAKNKIEDINCTYLGSTSNLKFKDLKEIIKTYSIDFAVIFDEMYSFYGFVDYFKYNLNLPLIGITKEWFLLELSKTDGKRFMKENGIKTADYMLISENSQLEKAIEKFSFPIVIKNNFLQAGFGSHICKDRKSAEKNVKQLLKTYKFCIAEHFLEGKEISQQYFWDKKKLLALLPVKDFKQNEKGINTGGLGCYTPVNLNETQQNLLKNYNEQLERIFQKLTPDFTGIFTVNLLFTKDEIYTLEFNMRPGITEFETLIEHLNTDLLAIFYNCVNSKLNESQITYKTGYTGCVVMTHKDYCKQNNTRIEKLALKKYISPVDNDIKLNFNIISFNKNMKISTKRNKTFLSVICTDKINPFAKIYKFLKTINSPKAYYRKDIGI